jgi:transposase
LVATDPEDLDPLQRGPHLTGASRYSHQICDEPANRARQSIGRSRGGLSTKVHALVEGRGRPLAAVLTAGQAGDNPQLEPLLDAVRVPRRGRGRPRRRPDRIVADKAYSHPSTRRALRRRGIAVTIPQRSDQVLHRQALGSAGGRPYAFDQEIYKRRNVVERYFNRLKQWRAIATRYDKTAQNYRGGVLLAGLVLWTKS